MSENNSTITPSTSSSPPNMSMFKSIMDSRKNTSLSLEQVIDKVNSRKESQGSAKARPRTARLRSFSASEISMQMYSNKSPSFADISNMYDMTSSPEVFNMSDINEGGGGSPTIEQAILMGCEEEKEQRGHLSSSSPDYNLEELVRALRIKHGVLEPPPTPSPPPSYYVRTPQSLFGEDTKYQYPKNSQTNQTQRPKLPSAPQQDHDSKSFGSTPEQYYMSGFEYISPSCPSSLSSSLSPASPNLETSLQKSTFHEPTKLYEATSTNENCTWSGTLPPRRHKNP